MAQLAIDAVRTASRLAEQEQRRRRRKSQQSLKDAAAQRQNSQVGSQVGSQGQSQSPQQMHSGTSGGGIDRSAPQRRPEFDMPTKEDGEIPDEFLPQV